MNGDAASRDEALSLLAGCSVMTIATMGEGSPWAAPVFFANHGFTLYFVSSPRSRHAQHILTDPRVAVAVSREFTDWREIVGLQMHGLAGTVTPRELPQALSAYLEKFPFAKEFMVKGTNAFRIGGKLLDIRFFKVTPQTAYLTDNRSGFGLRRPVPLE